MRKSGEKLLAVIHDAIVVPIDPENEPEQISLLKAEMIRALQFADAALNKGAGSRLRSLALSMGIPIDEAPDTGIEDEGDE